MPAPVAPLSLVSWPGADDLQSKGGREPGVVVELPTVRFAKGEKIEEKKGGKTAAEFIKGGGGRVYRLVPSLDEDDGLDIEMGVCQAETSLTQTPTPPVSAVSAALDVEAGLDKFSHRILWLLGLMILQSLGSAVLESFESLIKSHATVFVFLTMIIGSGGNAATQAAVLVIRKLATGQLPPSKYRNLLFKQLWQSVLMGVLLALAGFARVYLAEDEGDLSEVIAVSVSLLAVVIISIFIGVTLPIIFENLNLDPAHASAAAQVLVDIAGIAVTCAISLYFTTRKKR